MFHQKWADKEERFNHKSSCDKIFRGFGINNLNIIKKVNLIL